MFQVSDLEKATTRFAAYTILRCGYQQQTIFYWISERRRLQHILKFTLTGHSTTYTSHCSSVGVRAGSHAKYINSPSGAAAWVVWRGRPAPRFSIQPRPATVCLTYVFYYLHSGGLHHIFFWSANTIYLEQHIYSDVRLVFYGEKAARDQPCLMHLNTKCLLRWNIWH